MATKLVFVYGPPAVGKLTVARELAKLTRFKLFHNHLMVDLVESLFEFGSNTFYKIKHKFWMELLAEAAKAKLKGIIFTFCYAKREDDPLVRKLVKGFEKHGGRICFVRLYCSDTELIRRVQHESRKRFGKIKTQKVLKEVLKKWDLFSDIPGRKTLVIDNTRISPGRVARIIKKHYKL